MKNLVVFLTLSLFCAEGAAQEECRLVTQSTADRANFRYADLVKPSLTILEHPEKVRASSSCLIAAMFNLGRAKDPAAIPILVKWLTWEHKERNTYRLGTLSSKYPAIGALYDIGEPTIPALLEVIGARSPSDVVSQNALFVLMSIHRNKPQEGIKRLREASLKRSAKEKVNMEQAANDAAKKWCKTASCTP